jgi:predicted deacylase
MTHSISISGLKVEPGEKKRGHLMAGPYFHHKKAYIRRFELIPFTVIRGVENGPTLCQTSGCHGTEYAGIDATVRLAKAIQPGDLSGTFIAVHPVNYPGFLERSYINPLDGKDMQRNYPGNPNGTIAERMCYAVFNEAVLKSDYFLDCHGGDIHESLLWYAIYYGTDDEVEEKSESMVRASGLKYAAMYPYRPHRSMGMEAVKRGIPGFLYELGTGDKLIPEESEAVYNCTRNVMRYLGMLEGEPVKIENQPRTTEGQGLIIWKNQKSTHFTKAGLYHSDIQPGDFVEKGQEVGQVTDEFGEAVEIIHAPATGYISLMVHNPIARPGDEAIIVRW